MVHADSTALQRLAGELGSSSHATANPAWHSWQADDGRWWATRPGRHWQHPMTLGPARDRGQLAAILDREGGYRLDGRAG